MPSGRLFYNPSCSKCRSAWSILEEAGAAAEQVRYLDAAPSRDVLLDLLRMLGSTDPRSIVRTNEVRYDELGLASASDDELLDAIVQHPILLQRPIFVKDGRAVIARPAERVRELLEQSDDEPGDPPTPA